MKKIFLIAPMALALLVATAQTKKDKTVNITGNVTGDTKGFNNIYYYSSGTSMDSAVIKNGQFKISIPFFNTFTQLFYTQYEIQGHRGYRPFPVLIDEPGNITIDMKIEEGFYTSKLSGAPTAVLFNSFLKQQTDAYKKINDDLVKVYGKGWAPEKDPDYARINAGRDSLTKLYMGGLVHDFIKAKPDAFVSTYVLNMSGKTSMDIDALEKTYQLLSANQRKSEEGEKVAAYIRGVRNSGIGKTVKTFALNDPDGKPFSFDQLKGKYVMIDFWASWCGPCKQSFPHMREMYTKYRSDKFEIVAISTDATKEPWLKAVKEFNNPWPQVLDTKNISQEFAVTAYPTTFLIDPNGKILLREVGYEQGVKSEIEKKLEELFGTAKTASAPGEKQEGKKAIPATRF